MGLGTIELLVLLPVALILIWVFRPPSPKAVAFWASAYAVQVTERNERMLRAYLTRSQRWRRLGFGIGWLAASSFERSDDFAVLATPFLLIGVGYSAGIVAAEAFSHPVRTTGAAALDTRRLSQYLPAKLVRLPRLLTGLVVIAAAIALAVDADRTDVASDREVFALAAAAVAALLVAEIVQRAVVRRRQPLVDPDLLAADDALRAQSTHALAGAVIITAGSLLFPLLMRPGGADVLNPTFDLLAVFSPVAGWVVGVWYQNRAWRVRRSRPSATAAPTGL
jgi:hypothetical protein